MRTPQQALKDALPVIQAAAEGREIEFRLVNRDDWMTARHEPTWHFADPSFFWRLKPEPKRTLRPWKPHEVPVGAQIRVKGLAGISLILANGATHGIGVAIVDRDEIRREPYGIILEKYEHSTDGGKTWLPCGAWEEVA